MATFSQRMGIAEINSIIQVESMDTNLRNGIWNILLIYYFEPLESEGDSRFLSSKRITSQFFRLLWKRFFNWTLDSLPIDFAGAYQQTRDFFFSCEWYEVYDLLEFIATNCGSILRYSLDNTKFVTDCNKVLEQELSGYRLINGIITPITSEVESNSITESLNNPLTSVQSHLTRSMELLSDRTNPDFRNSIKESISAVEAICESIVGKHNASLGDALKIIKDKGIIELHPALNDAFNKLYGYTSNADGIRHALSEESNLYLEDAIYMLISCSTFINYLTVKANKVGITFK